MRGALVLVLALSVAGCSHTWFQFHVSAAEASAIDQNKNALAATAASRDLNALAQVVDLDGRRGAEILVAGMTVESTSADVQHARLTRALYFGIMGDGEDPLSALDMDLGSMAARVAQRVAVNQAQQMGFGAIASFIGAVGDDDGTRLTEMQMSLTRGQVATCQGLDPIISYNAGILGHIHSQMAESDPTYLAWRARVQSIHLVHYVCGSQHAVFLLSRNAGEPGVRALGWHFMRPDQWERLRPRLRQALDLPT
ncbi:MAG: hypothetical protein IT378_08820 [Sandaracinaceae bacterium]|nr:hypothetical protein [Sandaracinaceae bacterium]